MACLARVASERPASILYLFLRLPKGRAKHVLPSLSGWTQPLALLGLEDAQNAGEGLARPCNLILWKLKVWCPDASPDRCSPDSIGHHAACVSKNISHSFSSVSPWVGHEVRNKVEPCMKVSFRGLGRASFLQTPGVCCIPSWYVAI